MAEALQLSASFDMKGGGDLLGKRTETSRRKSGRRTEYRTKEYAENT